MYNWSVDEKKFKKEDPLRYKTWRKMEENIRAAVDCLAKNKWVKKGKIYIRKQGKGIVCRSPVVFVINLRDDMPKYKKVAFGFNLDENIFAKTDVLDQKKAPKRLSYCRLIASFAKEK